MTCYEELKAMRERYGTSNFDHAVKKLNRERLERGDANRPKRISFKWSLVKKLYNRQRGVCPRCKREMALDRGKIHVDHFDPNAADFNAESNLRVLHTGCNLSKNANSLYAEARTLNRPLVDLLQEQSALHGGEV